MCKTLNDNWGIVKQTLVDLSNNLNEKFNTCNEVRGLLHATNCFETTFLPILRRLTSIFNIVNKLPQSVNVDICTVCDHYTAFIKYVSNLHNNEMFLKYQEKALKAL